VSHVLLNGWKLDLGALVVLSNSCRAHGGAYRLHRPVFELVALLDASRKRGHSGIAAEYIGITDLGPMPTCDAVEMSNMCVPGAARDRASAEALWARLAKSGIARMPSAREVAQHSAFLSISCATACQFESSVSINFGCLLCRSGSSGGVPSAASTGVLCLNECTNQPSRNALATCFFSPRWDIRHHYGHSAHIGLRLEKIDFSWTLQVRSCAQASATLISS
ncbi:unnamed protein product, partial [Symbiodinium sp. CCMP2592]